ncbi:acyl-CoA dehydrogenase family protein [Alicyclobacillus suci]|uniref:acyl-CoA dehydrogenase family protein n=1 Tax=Alicyclobacillus suci TaxID=2816080 RepID=UPI001A909927|nr:acyl-CoA dehydrogenase family protein [Alicyclobacillus suci]
MTISSAVQDDIWVSVQRLAEAFAVDAVEREQAGGNAKRQRDMLRESGLLTLLIPERYGGGGETWSTVLRIVRELAKVDGSLAHLYGYHFLQLVAPHLVGTPEQKRYFYTESAKHNWFWGNAFNPLDQRLRGNREDGRVVLNGRKSFCTGAQDSDRLLVSWVEGDDPAALYTAVIPTRREGVLVHDDWDGLGQRQTDSGTVEFQDVVVEPHEIIAVPLANKSPFSTIDAPLSQMILANIFAGSATGALEAAKEYTRTQSRPWYTSGVNAAHRDPYTLRKYGDMWVELQGATSLLDAAGHSIDAAWEKEFSLTSDERGRVAVHTAAANALASKVALNVTSQVFEVMGARSATKNHGFDRFWRNVRTHTLHNPIDYKFKNIGNWYVNDEPPKPGWYA